MNRASKEMRGRAELYRAFKSTNSTEAMIKVLKNMDESKFFQESDLGLECWAVARQLLSDGGFPDKVLFFGNRALKSFLDNKNGFYTTMHCIKNKFSGLSKTAINDINHHGHGSDLFVASACTLLGAAYMDLERYDESLSYLNWATRNLSRFEADEGDNRCGGNCVLHFSEVAHLELCKVKDRMGRREEGVPHILKVVEIREKIMEEGCFELGLSYKDACSLYMAVLDTKRARPFCFKALEIYVKHKGPDTVEVAELRMNLGMSYHDSDETEKAIEQNHLSQAVLKRIAPNSPDLLKLEILNATLMKELGRHDEAIGILKGVVMRDDITREDQALIFLSMAKAYRTVGKFPDARKYMKTARRIIEKKGVNNCIVAMVYGDLSDQYMAMNDRETAMSLSKKALSIPGLLERIITECSSRIFSLVSLSGNEKDYMEEVVEKLEEKFGLEHCEVGYGYISLGAAYMKLGQQESAVKFMAKAKDILDATHGHISLFCSVEERNRRVIKILEKAIRSFEGKQEFVDIAVEVLNNLEGRVTESPTAAATQSIEDLCSSISKCGISGEILCWYLLSLFKTIEVCVWPLYGSILVNCYI